MSMYRTTDDAQMKHVEYERYALALLSAEAVLQGKPLLFGNELPNSLSLTDAYASEGILDVPGPCFIEMKPRISRDLFSQLRRVHNAYAQANFLIVVQERFRPRDLIVSRAQHLPGAMVKVIGRDELQVLAKKHPAAALPFESGNLDQAVGSFKVSQHDDKIIAQHISSLHAAYDDDRLALFVGAGISKSASYPDWLELVSRLASTVFDKYSESILSKEERDEVQEFFQSEAPTSPLIVARLLRDNLKSAFADAVRTALYQNVPSIVSSLLLKELGALCMPRRDRLGIVSVVNYNYDELLENELKSRGIQYRTIVSEDEKALRDELPIFHVHGYLPQVGRLTEAQKNALVLSEDTYHTQFVDPYLWTNLTQLNLLRNNVCLFVGMSMTDPNQRRLLEITVRKNANIRHYAILKDHWTGPKSDNLSANGKNLTLIFRGLEESSLAALGVTVIWVTGHDDIPPLLAKIRG